MLGIFLNFRKALEYLSGSSIYGKEKIMVSMDYRQTNLIHASHITVNILRPKAH